MGGESYVEKAVLNQNNLSDCANFVHYRLWSQNDHQEREIPSDV